jgi:hypothetical protein
MRANNLIDMIAICELLPIGMCLREIQLIIKYARVNLLDTGLILV